MTLNTIIEQSACFTFKIETYCLRDITIKRSYAKVHICTRNTK